MMKGMNVFARGWRLILAIGVILMAGALAAKASDCDTTTEKNRPISLGVSGGNSASNGGGFCCAGTLGSLVQIGSTQYILSNSHVLATRSGSQVVLQPGLADLNCVPNSGLGVADGVRTIPISSSKANSVDAAIARVIRGDVNSSGQILNIGNVAAGNAVAPTLNLAVQKMGSTTCETSGSITAVNVTIKVQYPTYCNMTVSGTATFTNQIEIGPAGFSGAGDSGSLIVTTGSCPAAVGLLFAGNSDGSATFANPMTTVLKSFGARMVGQTCGSSGGGGSGGGGSGGGGPGGGGGPPTGGLRAGISPSASVQPSVESMNFAAGVKQRHEPELFAQPGVLGAGVASSSGGQPVIKVYVDRATPAVSASIPSSLESVPVELEETGPIVAY